MSRILPTSIAARIVLALLAAVALVLAGRTPAIKSVARTFGLTTSAKGSPDENLRPIFNALQLEKDRAAVGRRYGKTAAELDAIDAQGRAAGWTVPTHADSSGSPGEDILSLQRQGLLVRLDVDGHSAHVDSARWAGVDASTKRAIVTTLSKHIESRSGTGHLKVYDSRDGRLVAEYSVWTGGVTLH